MKNKECKSCHGRGYITVIKDKTPQQLKSEQIPCVCRMRTGLSKEMLKGMRQLK